MIEDKEIKVVLELINNLEEFPETKEIEWFVRKSLEDVTRTKLFYRLTMLMVERFEKGRVCWSEKRYLNLVRDGTFRKTGRCEMVFAKIIIGDSRKMVELPDNSIDLVVTSPPYWHIKNYGVEGQIGYGQSPHEYLKSLYLV